MPAANRYLVSFDARTTFHRFTDVLVIGAGIAGLRAALEVPPDLSVLVVTKDRVTESNSSYAQGGIAGVRAPEDSFENHIRDTLVAGDGLCDRAGVEMTNGDGLAAAYRAGAELRDMEFMQFHPTILYVAGSSRSLISEAVRGEGAYLRDVNGERFMPQADPRAELAPRDVVARAIFRTMERTQHPNVYLDLSHLDPQLVLRRFPGINRACKSFGLDITKDRIPGIIRDKNRMLEAKETLRFWCRYALGREFESRAGWELQNLLTVARLMVASALARDESRGTHYRSDFPARDDERWGLRHVVCE